MIHYDGDVSFNRQTNRKSDLKTNAKFKVNTTALWVGVIILFLQWCDKHSFPRNLAELWGFCGHPDRFPCRVDNRRGLWWTLEQAAGSETRGAQACDEAAAAMAVVCCTSSTNIWKYKITRKLPPEGDFHLYLRKILWQSLLRLSESHLYNIIFYQSFTHIFELFAFTNFKTDLNINRW